MGLIVYLRVVAQFGCALVILCSSSCINYYYRFTNYREVCDSTAISAPRLNGYYVHELADSTSARVIVFYADHSFIDCYNWPLPFDSVDFRKSTVYHQEQVHQKKIGIVASEFGYYRAVEDTVIVQSYAYMHPFSDVCEVTYVCSQDSILQSEYRVLSKSKVRVSSYVYYFVESEWKPDSITCYDVPALVIFRKRLQKRFCR